MKKAAIILVLFSLIFCLAACELQENPPDTSKPTEDTTNTPTSAPTDAPTNAPTEAPTEAPTSAPTKAPTSAPTEDTTGQPAICGDDCVFISYYIDVVYKLGVLSNIDGIIWDDIQEEAESHKFNNYPDIIEDGLPFIYHFIAEYNITKEQFIEANEKRGNRPSKYSDTTIDLLFCGDIERMKEGLKSPYALYCGGKFYNIYDLAKLDAESILALDVSKEDFIAYLDLVENALREEHLLTADEVVTVRNIVNTK